MKIRPRQQLLEIWRSLLAQSYRDGQWVWADPDGRDSVVDAQQLLCLMSPTVGLPSMRFSHPDSTFDDVLQALKPFGGAVDIPRVVLRLLTTYMERHRDDSGPIFDGASNVIISGDSEVDADDIRLDNVEGFALSLTLTLASIDFARAFRRAVARPDLIQATNRLEELSSERLSAALVGLVRSFAVDTFEYESPEGTALIGMINQAREPSRTIANELREELRSVTASVRDLRLGSGEPGDLDNPNRLYQVGWSWGVITGTSTVDFVRDTFEQREGRAIMGAYLYFTVVALDGLADLFDQRTRLLGLLNEEQERLAQALQIRWDLTQQYWSTLATFGEDRWPLEDLPWRTLDLVEHDYYSLLVTAIAIRDLITDSGAETEIIRLGEILRELANRSRITRRSLPGDPALSVHARGIMVGMDLANQTTAQSKFSWVASDFAALLLKRVVHVLHVVRKPEPRRNLLNFLDDLWEHLLERRLGTQSGMTLWDQPANTFEDITDRKDGPSWQPTLRVVESLVQAAELVGGPPVRDLEVAHFADAMLMEAEHLYDQEILRGGVAMAPAIQESLDSVLATLERAREISPSTPGTAAALLIKALQDLDSLAAARTVRKG